MGGDATRLKSDTEATRAEFYRLVCVGKDIRPDIGKAFEQLAASCAETGVGTYAGRAYEGGFRRVGNATSFCLTDRGAAGLAAAFQLRIGGFPPKGDMLIRDEVIARLKAKAGPFMEAWERLDRAARRGEEFLSIGDARIRISMVRSGVRTAAALHPDDLDAFAAAVGLDNHLQTPWQPGWLNEAEAASRLGTHYANRGFRRCWRAMAQARGNDGAPGGWEAVRCGLLKKAGVVTMFLHEDSLQAFLDAANGGSRLAPPPKTEEWLWLKEVATWIGVHREWPALTGLFARLASEVEGGSGPQVDGRPVRFMRRKSGSAFPWCFHVEEMQRVMGHLGVVAVAPKAAGDIDRSEAFAACGVPSHGCQATKSVWDACIDRWKDGSVASVAGQDLHGRLRRGRGGRIWCLDSASLDGFVRAVDAHREMQAPDGYGRLEAALLLRVAPKEPGFRALWADLDAKARAGLDVAYVGGAEVRIGLARRTPSGPFVTCLDRASIHTVAAALGRQVRETLADATGYVHGKGIAEALGVPDEGRIAFLVEEIRRVYDEGESVTFEGETIACGYVRSRSTPFAIAAADIPTLRKWYDSAEMGSARIVRGQGSYMDAAELDAMMAF